LSCGVSAASNDAAEISGQCGNQLRYREKEMSIGTILLIVLIVLLVGALPAWPHSRSWGYYPTGGIGLVILILLVLVLMGRL
jgi:predicted nucleic acid-binding Zn ribbon protein